MHNLFSRVVGLPRKQGAVASPAHRYWRINGVKVSAAASSLLEISELQLFEDGVNLNSLATITSSAVPSSHPTHPLSNLFDANLSTRCWWAQATVEDAAFWIKWDFGAGVTKAVDGVRVGSFDTSSRYLYGYRLQYSDNDSDWTTVGTRTGYTHTANNSYIYGVIPFETGLATLARFLGTASNYVSTPDSVAVSITGDLEIHVRAALTDWTPGTGAALVAKWNTTGNKRCFILSVQTSGVIRLNWSTDGVSALTADSTVAPTVSNGATLWLRVTLDVNDGSGNWDVTFYTSADGSSWTQLGAVVTGVGVTSIFDSDNALALGSSENGASNILTGDIYRMRLYNGIGGTLVADFNPALDAVNGNDPITSSATGEIWTFTRAAVYNRTINLF